MSRKTARSRGAIQKTKRTRKSDRTDAQGKASPAARYLMLTHDLPGIRTGGAALRRIHRKPDGNLPLWNLVAAETPGGRGFRSSYSQIQSIQEISAKDLNVLVTAYSRIYPEGLQVRARRYGDDPRTSQAHGDIATALDVEHSSAPKERALAGCP
jgi:hypothetical protein